LVHLARGLPVQAFDRAHRGLHPARRHQVGLLDEIEGDVLVPGLVLEAPVALLRHHQRLGRLAGQPPRGRLPQGDIVAPQVGLRLYQPGRIGHRLDAPFDEGFAHHGRVEDLEAVVLRALLEGLVEHVPAALDQLGPSLGQRRGIVRTGPFLCPIGHVGPLLPPQISLPMASPIVWCLPRAEQRRACMRPAPAPARRSRPR
jgi:hypothetical protein